jgi:AcrR family transcriptional regulator
MTDPRAQRRRPRDRRQQILAAAAEHFRSAGYHNVGMAGIAEAVGITGAAVYRHFRSKQDLLLAVLQDAFDRFATVWALDYEDLDALLLAMATLSLQWPDIGVLWEREVVHLPAGQEHELRVQVLAAVAPVRAAIARARPDLQPDVVDLLLWAVMALSASNGYHSVKLQPGRYRARFAEAARAICATTSIASTNGGHVVPASPEPKGKLLPASRREAVLTAATRLFSQYGYESVGVDDIGAAVGITGATLYHHFASKPAILTAVLTRCSEAMFFDLASALDAASSPGEALDLVLQSTVRASVEHGRVIGALLDEIGSLPAEEAQTLRQARRDHVAEWVALLVAHRPGLTEAEAQVLAHSTVSMVNSLLLVPHIAARPASGQELVTLGRAVLGLPDHPITAGNH